MADQDNDVFVGFTSEAPETPQEPQEKPEATLTPDEPEIEADEPETGADEAEDTTADADEDEAEKKHRSKPAKERISELTRARREAERRAEAAEARLAQLTGGQDQQQGGETALAEPDPNEFEFGEADPGYLRALAVHTVRQEMNAARQAEAQQAQAEVMTQRAQALDTTWQEQAEKAVERYEDFAPTIEEYQKTQPCPPILAMAIQASDHGADVAYHLAKNPKENAVLAQLAQTDPLEAARRFGRLEARFESREEAPKPKAKTITDAPEPPSHRARGSAGRFETPDDTDDLDAFSRKFFAK